MRLKDATVENMALGNVTFTSIKPFLDELYKARNLIADIYVNTKLLMSSNASIRVDHNEMFASIDGRFALSEPVDVSSILVRIHESNSDTILLSSMTLADNLSLETHDYDIDMFIKIASVVPNDTSIKSRVPDTVFHSLYSDLSSKIDLDSQPNQTSSDITVEDTVIDDT